MNLSWRGPIHRIGSSIWFIPFVAIPLELIAVRIVHYFDARLNLTLLGLDTAGAKAMYDAIVSANLAFLVFTFGSLLVAVQVASAQLTPRIIATTLLSDRTIKYCVGLFIFTLLFCIGAQNRIGADVGQLPAFVAAVFGIVCFAAFFFLIDHASRLLRPVSVLSQVGNTGLEVLASVYPDKMTGPDAARATPETPTDPPVVVGHLDRSGIVLSVDASMLMDEAARTDTVIEFAPQVGDFVATGEALFLVHGHGVPDESRLRNAVEFGSERTMEQDPTFAFRIVVDIALRALSPAINDPTTAVLAIDQLHRLLRSVGLKHLRTDELRDRNGRLRAIVRTPNWGDFVHLSFREIRRCGSDNLQVARRLRAMIENLLKALPAQRLPAIAQELELLDREIAQKFPYPEDLALARIGDPQGLGGRSGDRSLTKSCEHDMTEAHPSASAPLRTPKAAAIAGIVFAVLLIAIFVLFRSAVPGSPTEPGEWLADQWRAAALGLNLIPFAGVAFLWFIGVLRDRLGAKEDRFFATVFFGSSLLFLALLFTAASLTGALILIGSLVGAEKFAATPTFYFARATAFILVNVYAAKIATVFMVSTSTVVIYTKIAPRWIAILGYVLAVALLVGSYFTTSAIVVLPLWVLLISIAILIDNLRMPAQA